LCAQAGGPALHLPAYDAWDGLALEYAAAWPLPLLLTPAALAAYGGLSRFLLRLARACAELDAAWAALRGGGRARAREPACRARCGTCGTAWRTCWATCSSTCRRAPGALLDPGAACAPSGNALVLPRVVRMRQPHPPCQCTTTADGFLGTAWQMRRAAESCVSDSIRMQPLGVASSALPLCQPTLPALLP